MIHIKKKEEPKLLEDLRVDANAHGSRYYITEVRKHLIEEQNGLCAYCECRIEKDNSHTDHLKPKSIYPNLEFNYNNLVASCEGFFPENKDRMNKTCGHRKDSKFDEDLFLDPTTIINIANYFIYNKDTGEIFPNPNKCDNEQMQATYMIDLLNLNSSPPSKYNNALPIARLKAKRALIYVIKNAQKEFGTEYRELLAKLITEKTAFISFLKYSFFN